MIEPSEIQYGGVAVLSVLKARFEAYMPRHADLSWAAVKARLQAHPAALEALRRMEETGGEPDVIGYADDGERRYGVVFTFHNGAESCYSVRGWRGCLTV